MSSEDEEDESVIGTKE